MPFKLLGRVTLICSLSVCTFGPQKSSAQVKILFDATKAEMAGSADWIIDADQFNVNFGPNAYTSSSGYHSNPQQIPTPAQSGVTASTSEGYWTGCLSYWAVDCAKRGYIVESLPYNGIISYGNSSNPQDLSNYKVYIVDEPNIQFTAAEKTAMIQFVQHGGGLFMISDHTASDRNSDGWDSPAIWNDFLSTNSVQSYPFGIKFDLVDISGTYTNVIASSTDSLIHGPMGNVAKVQWSSGTTMTLDPAANSTVKGVVYKTGASGNTNALVAYARYGTGKVASIGDSSPTDDGTGNTVCTSCTYYNGYTADASGNHRLLLMNATIWLATNDGGSGPSGVKEVTAAHPSVFTFPNPSNGQVSVSADKLMQNVSLSIIDVMGRTVVSKELGEFGLGRDLQLSLLPGSYVLRVANSEFVQTSRITVY